MPTARGLLSMATYKALPDRFASVSEASSTPKYATWVIGLTSLAIYCMLDVVSDSVVSDSVYSVGIAIMTYYSVVAISSVVYFWRTAFRSWRTAMGQVILPGIGALILIPVGVVDAYLMADPSTGSGSSILDVGTAFVVGVLSLAFGVVLMILWNLKAPGLLPRQDATDRADLAAVVVAKPFGPKGRFGATVTVWVAVAIDVATEVSVCVAVSVLVTVCGS